MIKGMMDMWLVNFLGGGILLIFGILIRVFNLSGLIAGYNTASPKQKAKYDERKLTRFVGLWLITSSAILLAGGIFIALDAAQSAALLVSWLLWFMVMLAGLFYVNLSPKFKSKNPEA